MKNNYYTKNINMTNINLTDVRNSNKAFEAFTLLDLWKKCNHRLLLFISKMQTIAIIITILFF